MKERALGMALFASVVALPFPAMLGPQVVLGEVFAVAELTFATPLVVIATVLVSRLYVEDALGDHAARGVPPRKRREVRRVPLRSRSHPARALERCGDAAPCGRVGYGTFRALSRHHDNPSVCDVRRGGHSARGVQPRQRHGYDADDAPDGRNADGGAGRSTRRR
jgi:hypothetical protein